MVRSCVTIVPTNLTSARSPRGTTALEQEPGPMPNPADFSRRNFLKGTAAVLAGSTAQLGLNSVVYAAGSDTLRVGLVGCGNRGTGAAMQALKADPNVQLVAMGDTFA